MALYSRMLQYIVLDCVMSELLTTKQVQEYLQVDRTTVYRMLKDGRLQGIKVGKQWRFPRSKIAGMPASTEILPTSPKSTPCDKSWPVDCMQAIQDLTADTMEVGAVIANAKGIPVTNPSHVSRFCQMILSTESGRQACMASWRELSRQPGTEPRMGICHAGCHLARAGIQVGGQADTMLIAGQFFLAPPDPIQQAEQMKVLARVHGLDEGELKRAAQEIPVISEAKQTKIIRWLKKLADTFSMMAQERIDMLDRFRQIADMSTEIVQ